MKKNHLFALWGLLFILCAGLGFHPEETGWMTFVSLLFFLPPALLLHQGSREEDRHFFPKLKKTWSVSSSTLVS